MSGPRVIDRFTFFERLVHWVVGVSFVLLLLTGFALSYPHLFWLTALVGGGAAARVLHPWTGIVFSIGLVVMFFVWLRDMYITKADVAWMKAIGHYVRHDRDQVPPAGKYNGGQKVFFWVQSILGIVFLATGVPLWLPATFGPALLTTMRLIHYVAALGAGLFLIVHVYLGTVAYPGTARGMLYGTVTRGWAKLHHPLWYRDKAGS